MQHPLPDESRRQALALGARLAALSILPPALASCGGEAALIVPFITFVFEGVVTSNGAGDRQVVQLNLDPNGTLQGKSTGSLDTASISTRNLGTAVGVQPAAQARPVTGSISGGSIAVNVAGAVAPLDTAYAGQFTALDTIVLTPQTPGRASIKLLRVDNSMRPDLHASAWSGKDGQGRPWTLAFQTDPPFDSSATEALTGTDVLAGQPGTFTGHAVMRDLQITVVRGGATTRLSGTFGPAGPTPPSNNGNLAPAQTLSFPDGSLLVRGP